MQLKQILKHLRNIISSNKHWILKYRINLFKLQLLICIALAIHIIRNDKKPRKRKRPQRLQL